MMQSDRLLPLPRRRIFLHDDGPWRPHGNMAPMSIAGGKNKPTSLRRMHVLYYYLDMHYHLSNESAASSKIISVRELQNDADSVFSSIDSGTRIL